MNEFLSLKIGVVPALINYNLRQTPLKHCIETVKCKALVFSPALAEGKVLIQFLKPFV